MMQKCNKKLLSADFMQKMSPNFQTTAFSNFFKTHMLRVATASELIRMCCIAEEVTQYL